MVPLGGRRVSTWGLIVWMFGEAFGQIFSPGPSWLFGLPGRRAVLLRRRCAHSPTRDRLEHPPPGTLDLALHGHFLAGHGPAPGLAGQGLLAGPADACLHARVPHGDGPTDGDDAPAALSCRRVVSGLRHVRRGTRLGREPFFGRGARRDRGCFSSSRSAGSCLRRRRWHSLCLADWVLVAGLRFLWRGRHRPQQHGPDGPRVHRRLPRRDEVACTRSGQRAALQRPPPPAAGRNGWPPTPPIHSAL